MVAKGTGRVVDASVLAALVFGEPRSAEAHKLLTGSRLYAPSLLAYELTQVAVKKIANHPTKRGPILEALSAALSLDIQLVDVDFVAVAELAMAAGLTAYDACYLHLSRVLDISLATFDETLKSRSAA
jgi:predicted nucleic acid-binding protein